MTSRLLLIAVAIILLLMGTSFWQHFRLQELKAQRTELIAMVNDSARQAKQYRDRWNVEHSKNKVLMIARDNQRRLMESEEFAWTKKFEALKKNEKNLVQTTKIESRIDTVLHIQRDTVDRPMIAQILYEDTYNQVAIDSGGVNLTFKIEAPIEGIIYWQRKYKILGIRFGKKQYYSDFKCLNKLVHITQSEVIQVRRK